MHQLRGGGESGRWNRSQRPTMKTAKNLLGILPIGFALWFGTPAQAQTDDSQPLANVLVEAEKGDAKAQYDYGIILEQKKLYAEALQWFCMAAEQNYSAAQYKIGVYFENRAPKKQTHQYE